MRIQNRQDERQDEEHSREPGGELDQDVRRLRAENVFSHAAAKRRAKSFALRPLHQDHEDHEQRHENVDREHEVNQDLHRGAANMARSEDGATAHRFFTSFQIASSSARSTSPSFLPRAVSSSSSKLNRPTNLSVAACSALSASSFDLR